MRRLTEETRSELKKPKYTFHEWCEGHNLSGKGTMMRSGGWRGWRGTELQVVEEEGLSFGKNHHLDLRPTYHDN